MRALALVHRIFVYGKLAKGDGSKTINGQPLYIWRWTEVYTAEAFVFFLFFNCVMFAFRFCLRSLLFFHLFNCLQSWFHLRWQKNWSAPYFCCCFCYYRLLSPFVDIYTQIRMNVLHNMGSIWLFVTFRRLVCRHCGWTDCQTEIVQKYKLWLGDTPWIKQTVLNIQKWELEHIGSAGYFFLSFCVFRFLFVHQISNGFILCILHM